MTVAGGVPDRAAAGASVAGVRSPTAGLHVAVLNPAWYLGGAEISLLELLRRTAGDPQVTLLVPREGPFTAAAAAVGVRVEVLPWPTEILSLGDRAARTGPAAALRAVGSAASFVRALRRGLAGLGAQLLLTNGIKAHILGAWAAGSRLPHVWYLREGLEDRRLSRQLLRLSGRRCAGAICISNYVADQFRQVLPIGTPRAVLYNLVDLERFRPGIASELRASKRSGEIWFAVVGALTPLKGQDLFLEAAALLAPRLPGARFLLVGHNPYPSEAGLGFEAQLRQRAEELGISGRVDFLGFRDDVPAVLAAVDVLVQPNRGPEGFGRSVAEAMAMAVPVIATDRGALSELVADGLRGVLVLPGDVAALAEAMFRLGVDAHRRRELGAQAREWLVRTLRPSEIVADFRTFLTACAKMSPADTG